MPYRIDPVSYPPGVGYSATTLVLVGKRDTVRLLNRLVYTDGRVEVGATNEGCERFGLPRSAWKVGAEEIWERLKDEALAS